MIWSACWENKFSEYTQIANYITLLNLLKTYAYTEVFFTSSSLLQPPAGGLQASYKLETV